MSRGRCLPSCQERGGPGPKRTVCKRDLISKSQNVGKIGLIAHLFIGNMCKNAFENNYCLMHDNVINGANRCDEVFKGYFKIS